MKTIYLITCLFLFSNIQLGATQKILNLPASVQLAEKSLFIEDLGKLIAKKEIKLFYEKTNEIVEHISISSDSTVSPQHLADYLYLRYLVALAPLIDSNKYENIQWLSDHDHPDLKIKSRILRLMSSRILHDACFTKKYALPKGECVDLYNQTQALIINQFRSAYNPQIKSWEHQKRLYYSKNERLYSTRDEVFSYFNAINVTKLRNELMKNEIMHREKYFIKSLVEFYPDEASKTIRLMESAGYDRREMPNLIDRTEGRSEKTRYLYKNLPRNVGSNVHQKI